MLSGLRHRQSSWMTGMQPVLLRMARTDYGRDLLNLDKNGLPLISLRENEARYHLGFQNGHSVFLSDFRVGAMWREIIRERWSEFNSFSRYFLNDYDVPLSPLTRYALSVVNTTDTYFSDADPEPLTVDGMVRATPGSVSYSTLRSSSGSGAFDSNSNFSAAVQIAASNVTNEYYQMRISIFLFDTSSIGSDTVSDASLSFVCPSAIDGLSATFFAAGATTSSNTSLTSSDFQNTLSANTTPFSSSFSPGSLTADDATYNDIVFNSAGKAGINKTGITKLSFQPQTAAPAWADSVSSSFGLYYAEQGSTKRTKLVVTHSSAVPGDVSPNVLYSTFSIPAPTVAGASNTSPSTQNLTVTVQAPVLNLASNVNVQSLASSAPTPTVRGGASIIPSPLSMAATVVSPTLSVVIQPNVLTLTASVQSVLVSAGAAKIRGKFPLKITDTQTFSMKITRRIS